jgi:hypothetical protein
LASLLMNGHAQVQQGNIHLLMTPGATQAARRRPPRGRQPFAVIGPHYDVIVMDRQLRKIRNFTAAGRPQF